MNEILSKMTHSSWNHKSIMEFSCSAPYVQESKLLIDFTVLLVAPPTTFLLDNKQRSEQSKLVYKEINLSPC